MLTNQQLVAKAHNAILNYHLIYGKYPAIVGIERNRLNRMQTTQIAFPALSGPLPPFYLEESDVNPLDILSPSIHMETVYFLPVIGQRISPDEVYFRHKGGDDKKAASGAAIARLWRMIERRRAVYAPISLRLESSKSLDETFQ